MAGKITVGRFLDANTDSVDVGDRAARLLGHVDVDSLPAIPLPSGAATEAKQDVGNASLASIDGKLTAPLSVTGPLTDTELRASPVPVSAAALPLPSGAATEAKQDAGNASLASIDAKLTAPVSIVGTVSTIQGTTPWVVDGSAVVQPISAATLPLPAGASTESKQDAGNASLVSIDAKLTPPLAVTGPLTDVELRASPVPVSAAALPLPAGAATEAKQDAGNASLVSIDAKLTSPVAVTGPLTDTQLRASPVPVSAAALPLPAGAATEAKQDVGNASLASIDAKLTAPVSVTGPLTDAQLRASPVPVSGTVTANLGTVDGLALDATITGGTQRTKITDGVTNAAVKAAATAAVAADPALVVAISPNNSVAITAAALPLPAGAATAAKQDTGNASLASIDAKLTAPVSVTGPLTDTQLRASPVPVSGTVTSNQGTSAGAALPWSVRLSDGAAFYDSAKTGQFPAALVGGRFDTNTGAWLGSTAPTVGQKTSANSVPIVIASDQSAVPVSQSTAAGAAAPWSVRLSDGAAFYDGTKTGQLPSALVGGRLDANLGAWLGSTAPTVGQKTMANSVPVAISSDQTDFNVKPRADTATRSDVASSAASVTLISANTSRKGLTIFNDSSKTLYVKFGTTASATDFTVVLVSQAYYEVPFGYTGRIDGIWSAANGSARMTEMT